MVAQVVQTVTNEIPAPQKTVYTHTDRLGSVQIATDETGSILSKSKLDPYGNRIANFYQPELPTTVGGLPPASGVTKGFTGHEHDDALGLINMRGRMYDPRLGRFLTTDPIVQTPLLGASYNRYAYVMNNPLRWTDPTGNRSCSQEEYPTNAEYNACMAVDVVEISCDTDPSQSHCPKADLPTSPSSPPAWDDYAKFLADQDKKNSSGSGGGSNTPTPTGVDGGGNSTTDDGGGNSTTDDGGGNSTTDDSKEDSKTDDNGFGLSAKGIINDILKAGKMDLNDNVTRAREMTLPQFIAAVRTGGIWDYKNNRDLKDAGFSPDVLQRFGNWHFGVVAQAYGFNLETSLYGAGMFQVFGQGGGDLRAFAMATTLMRNTMGGTLLPDSISRFMTQQGFTWGDNPGDSVDIIQGWDYANDNY